MIEDLKTLYTGKATIIKEKQYLSAKAYVQPFIERMETYKAKFICEAKQADQLSYDGNNIDTVYNKVLVTAVLPSDYDFTVNYTEPNLFSTQDITSKTYHRVVCMSYALDVKTPVCKFYTGVVDGDMNFYAFGKDCISVQEIETETPIDFSPLTTIVKNGINDVCNKMLAQFKSIKFNSEDIYKMLGEWIDFTITKDYSSDFGKVKLSSSMAIEAYKRIAIDKDSEYYSDAKQRNINDLYRAWSSQIEQDDKDIINRYEKTQLINRLFKLC